MPVSNWPGYDYFYLAEQAGLARAQAVPLNTVEFADPQAIVHAYVCGDLAIAKMATVEAVDICARVPERCPVVALVLDESVGGDQVMARQGITAIEQLRGGPVGVSLSTLVRCPPPLRVVRWMRWPSSRPTAATYPGRATPASCSTAAAFLARFRCAGGGSAGVGAAEDPAVPPAAPLPRVSDAAVVEALR